LSVGTRLPVITVAFVVVIVIVIAIVIVIVVIVVPLVYIVHIIVTDIVTVMLIISVPCSISIAVPTTKRHVTSDSQSRQMHLDFEHSSYKALRFKLLGLISAVYPCCVAN